MTGVSLCMRNVVEIRCPVGPQRLFTKLRLGQVEHRYVPEDNTIEFACADCSRQIAEPGRPRPRVLHRYNFLGVLTETTIEARG